MEKNRKQQPQFDYQPEQHFNKENIEHREHFRQLELWLNDFLAEQKA